MLRRSLVFFLSQGSFLKLVTKYSHDYMAKIILQTQGVRETSCTTSILTPKLGELSVSVLPCLYCCILGKQLLDVGKIKAFPVDLPDSQSQQIGL